MSIYFVLRIKLGTVRDYREIQDWILTLEKLMTNQQIAHSLLKLLIQHTQLEEITYSSKEQRVKLCWVMAIAEFRHQMVNKNGVLREGS